VNATPGTAGAALPDLLDARAAAIAEVGWGQRVGWRQPRNACLWVFVAVIAYGLWYTISTVRTEAPVYGTPLTIAAIIFSVYAVVFWWFTTHIDRYSRQPLDLRIAAFVWGGFGATWTIAIHGNTALIHLYAKWFGNDFSVAWGAGLAAPFVEESAKGAGVLLLMFIAPRVIRTAFDGFVIGAFVGLGFEIIEDILYAFNAAADNFGVDPVGQSLHTTLLRLGTGFTSHILYSAVVGAGVVYIVGTVAERRRIGRGLLFIALSIGLHLVWDSTSAIGQGKGQVILVLLFASVIVALVVVLLVFHVTVETERDAMRRLMTPEEATGVITAEELSAVAGSRKDRKAYTRGGGATDRRRRRHRLQAAFDLADEIGAAGGVETERVAFARAELARFAPLPEVTPRSVS
jgi:RsiW-degrading membrane proteinase PrsW (M82 family)